MEVNKRCSNSKHSEINAISYCTECNLYLCNKCLNIHIEYLETHHIINLNKNNKEIFTGFCQEVNHKNKLEYYCKNHNKLCCVACLCKIKSNGNGQHSSCDVCDIKDIKEEKINKLNDNIKYLEEASKKIKESIKNLKEIYEKINESKEEMKLKISKIFSKIRNALNEREEQLLFELDNIYDNSYFKEDIIKKGEKIPNQIKTYLEKGKLLNNELNDDNKLIEMINSCINIENEIKNISEINENIDKCNSKNIKIQFLPENEHNIELMDSIKKFGEIFYRDEFKFKFKPGNNYNISNNGLIATKNNGGNKWNCVIMGEKEIPKDRISKWKIKINNVNKSSSWDIFIGIGPNIFKSELYNECWSIFRCNTKVQLCLKNNKNINYNNHNDIIKEGDIIEVIVDRKNGNLSFSLNDINYGIACSTIPKDDILYPTVVLFDQGLSVELV